MQHNAIPRTWAQEHLASEYLEVLLRVRDDLASGKIPAYRFDMAVYERTVWKWGLFPVKARCIAGWMSHYARDRIGVCTYAAQLYKKEDRISSLFYGTKVATVAQAVQAIDNFIQYGDAYWDAVN